MKLAHILLLVSVGLSVFYRSALSSHVGADFNPSADPGAIVQAGKARFTVLTDCLLRLEWGIFHDEQTFVVLNRHLPVPSFTHHVDENNWLEIATDCVVLHYLVTSNVTFNPDNFNIRLLDPDVATNTTYRPFSETTELQGNLLGTIRTLDREEGWVNINCLNQTDSSTHCALGLISRSGFALLDDTNGPRFDGNQSWPWLTNFTAPQAASSDACEAAAQSEPRMCGGPNAAISEMDCRARGCCYNEKAKPPLQCFYTKMVGEGFYYYSLEAK